MSQDLHPASANLRFWGSPNAKIMVVVEAPTQEDMEYGELMHGWAGKFIHRGLVGTSYQVVSVFDRPIAKIKVGEFGAALAEFQAALKERSAQIIVPLGSIALEAVAGSQIRNIMEWRGYFIKPDLAATIRASIKVQTVYKSARPATKILPARPAGTPRTINKRVEIPVIWPSGVEEILPTLTPQTVQKSGLTLMSVMYGDLHKAVQYVLGNSKPDEPSCLLYTETPVTPNEVLVVDTETDWNRSLKEIGLYNGHNISTTTVDKTNVCDFIPHFAACKLLIAHNAAFEFEVLSKVYDLRHVALWDTMLAAYMLEPDGKKSLNWAISQYLYTRRHKHLSDSDPRLYNALDVAQTAKLYTLLSQKLHASGQLNFFKVGMMPAIPTLTRMTQRGLRVDHGYARQWYTKILVERDSAILSLGANRMGLASRPKALAKLLGVRVADEEQLLKLKAKGHPETDLIEKVLECRRLTKESQYYQSSDFIHPSYLPGTRDTDEGNKGIAYSGRPTASGPNIQNQPPDARRQFISAPGNVLVSLDWSQIEPRIIAALSEDDVLAADIEVGLYDQVAKVLSCPRSVAKTVVLLSAYLGSPKTLQNKLMLAGITTPYAECKALQDRMFSRYSAWRKWRDKVVLTAEIQRSLQNCFGKRAPFVRPHPAKAVNFHPQSTAACILWYCLPQVEKAIEPFGATITTTVHDEILLECAIDRVQEVSGAAKAVMNQEWPQVSPGFRVPVKVKVGTNWRDMLALSDPWNAYAGIV